MKSRHLDYELINRPEDEEEDVPDQEIEPEDCSKTFEGLGPFVVP